MASQTLDKVAVKNRMHVDPIGDPLMMSFAPGLVAAVQDIVLGRQMESLVKEVAGVDSELICVMSMLFGRKSGTPGHQDAYYLSSLPEGRIHAAWVALEDIGPNDGRFWVLNESSRSVMSLSGGEVGSADAYEAKIKQYVEDEVAAGRAEVFAPEMKAGDVLIWNVNTIHGSMKHGPDFSTSRLSFTAHYISRDDDFVLSAYNPKVRKIDFIETGHPILCRETTTYKPKEAGFVPNVRSYESFGARDPNVS